MLVTGEELHTFIVEEISDGEDEAAQPAGEQSDTAPVRGVLAKTDPSIHLGGYYIRFEQTGIAIIDTILRAVGWAGKAHHHTDAWNDETPPYEGVRGNTPVEWIQNAANDAAAALATPPAIVESVARARRDALEEAAKCVECMVGTFWDVAAAVRALASPPAAQSDREGA